MRHGALRRGFFKHDFPNDNGRIITMTTTTPFRFTLKKGETAFVGTAIVNLTNPRLFALNPNTNRMVCLRADGDLCYSDDFGVTWSAPIDVAWGSVSQMQRACVIWSEESQMFFAGQGAFSRMARSPDGENWTIINYTVSNNIGPFPTMVPGKLLVWGIPTQTARGYSLDYGTTWAAYATPLPIPGASKPALNRLTGRMVIASSDAAFAGGNAAYSDDDGETWTQSNIAGRDGVPYAVWWDEQTNLFFFTQQGGAINKLWYSVDGITWLNVTFPQATAVNFACGLDDGTIAVIGATNWYVVQSLSPFVYTQQAVGAIAYESVFAAGASA